ncbi:hypothetical protein RB595_009822 [Gaeumannomyces hyphopodioides]
MPIGDLLASITGEKPKSAPGPAKTSLPLKRKAEDDDARNRAQKLQRTTPSTDGRSLPAPRKGDGAGPLSEAKSSTKPTLDSARLNLGNGMTRPVSSQPLRSRVAPSTGPRVSSQQSPDSPATVKAAPKKGSFAEIMARAVKAQQSMGQVGKIQHKPLDKVPPKRGDRPDSKADGSRDPRRRGKGQPAPGAAGQRGGMNGSAAKNGDRNTDRRRSPGPQASRTGANSKKEAAPALEVKKVKKAAVATTGYQGTARPPPSAPSKRGTGAAVPASGNARNGADHRRHVPFGGARSRSRRDDEYDEMDDFIDDDEDDPEESGYRSNQYRYASEEDESDMEAGLSDIDDEEREAEILGRREDREQEALEQRLKREKEERKRRFMQAAAAKRR